MPRASPRRSRSVVSCPTMDAIGSPNKTEQREGHQTATNEHDDDRLQEAALWNRQAEKSLYGAFSVLSP